MAAGTVLAAAAGFPLGITAGMTGKAVRAVSLPAYLLHPVPKTVLIPLIVLAAGVGEASKILLVFLSLVFHLLLSTRDAVREIDSGYYTSIRAAGGSGKDELRWVVIPASLPALFSAMRISLGIAAAVLFFAEYFGTEKGMGFFIMDARARINFTDLYAGILALSLMVMVFLRLTAFAERNICRWSSAIGRPSIQYDR